MDDKSKESIAPLLQKFDAELEGILNPKHSHIQLTNRQYDTMMLCHDLYTPVCASLATWDDAVKLNYFHTFALPSLQVRSKNKIKIAFTSTTDIERQIITADTNRYLQFPYFRRTLCPNSTNV